MEDFKYCPDCETEYVYNINNCADCGTPLKTAGEIEKLKADKKYVLKSMSTEGMIVKEGGMRWIQELYNHLMKKGFTCKIIKSAACAPGNCGETFQLVVPSDDAEQAFLCLQEYHVELHPELKESHEHAAQGNCPACGYSGEIEAEECPDCGLIVSIEDDF